MTRNSRLSVLMTTVACALFVMFGGSTAIFGECCSEPTYKCEWASACYGNGACIDCYNMCVATSGTCPWDNCTRCTDN